MQSQEDDELRLTKLLGERYRDLFKVGSGGMGVVCRAYDPMLDRHVAIKVMRPEGSYDVIRRFQQEARAAAKLKHDNAVRELDCGVLPDNSLYIVMEFLDGISLEKLVAARGKMSSRQAVPIFLQIVNGMEHAHGIGLLHRDLKPSNIILLETPGAAPVAKIVDFGLAIATENREETTSDAFSGSPLYMAPEASETRLVDERSDIYSLGCLMMFCLTGSPPFVGKNLLEVLIDHREKSAPRLGARIPASSFPPELEDIVARCLEKNPDLRYQSMKELCSALVRVQGELFQQETAASLPVSEPVAVETRSAGPRGLLWVVAILILAGLCAFASSGVNSAFKVKTTPKTPNVAKTTKATYQEDDNFMNSILEHKFAERVALGKKWVYNQPPVEDEDFKELSKRKNIERLWLHECELNGTGLKYLEGNPIESLAFIGCGVDSNGVKEVLKFDKITVLRFIRDPFLKDESLRPLPKVLKLHTLYVSECTGLTNESMKTIAQFTTLRKLSLKDMPQFNSAGIARLANTPNLEILNLAGTSVDASGFKTLKRFKHMYALDVGFTGLTDGNMADLALPALEALCVRKTDVTLEGLKKLKKCKKLRLLDVRECKNLQAQEIFALQQYFPNVSILNQYHAPLSFSAYEDDLLMWISPIALGR
jgi:serine/threonine protein kinase